MCTSYETWAWTIGPDKKFHEQEIRKIIFNYTLLSGGLCTVPMALHLINRQCNLCVLDMKYGPGPKVQIRKFYEPKIVIFFLPINLNMCFGCSKVPSHRDGSLEYPQHMFWLRNKKNNFQLCTLIWGPVYPYGTTCYK